MKPANSIEQLQERLKAELPIRERIDTLNSLSWELRRTDPKKAQILCKEAEALLTEEEPGYQKGRAGYLINSSYQNQNQSKIEEAIKQAIEAQSILETVDESALLIRGLLHHATIRYIVADYTATLELATRALKLARVAEDELNEASASRTIGVAYSMTGDPGRALKEFDHAAQIYEGLEKTDHAATAYSDMATCYYKLKQYETGLEFGQKALGILRESTNRAAEAINLGIIGLIYYEMSEWDQSMAYHRQKLEIVEELDSSYMRSYTFHDMGKIHLKLGEIDTALKLLSDAIGIAEENQFTEALLLTYETLVEAYKQKEDYPQALTYLERFLELKDKTFNDREDQRRKALMIVHETQQAQLEAALQRHRAEEIARQAEQELNEKLKKLVEARTRDLNIASDIARQVTTVLELERLLPQVAQQTKDSFEMYFVGIYLNDAEKDMLIYQASSMGDTDQQTSFKKRNIEISAKPSLIAKAARDRKVITSNDVSKSKGYLFIKELPHTKAEMAIPMIVGDELIGVLSIQSDVKDRFADEDVSILSTLAEQMAIAIKNAQLFEKQVQVAEELRQADQIKSQFLASMSHELRTPLNAILTFNELLAMEALGPVTDEQKRYLQQSLDSGNHLLSLINDVLDITKIQSGMLTLRIVPDLDLREELDKAISTAESILKDKAVEFVTEIEDSLPRIEGDKRRIKQVILNLISNACKFTETGSVTLSAKADKDKTILITVADTGPGIATLDQTIIFEPFQQSESGIQHAGGTGLGLPISKSLVDAHGGKLWCESEVGKGTTFYIMLPIKHRITEVAHV